MIDSDFLYNVFRRSYEVNRPTKEDLDFWNGNALAYYVHEVWKRDPVVAMSSTVLCLSVNEFGVVSLWDHSESRPEGERRVDLRLTQAQQELVNG